MLRNWNHKTSACHSQRSARRPLIKRHISWQPLLLRYELLEDRRMLAALTPAQVLKAYGIDQIQFAGVKGDGTGQTIAIIDGGDDSKFLDSTSANFSTSDLAQFDLAFGLVNPPSFRVIGETGGARPGYINISSISESGNTVTVTTATPHGLASGANVTIAEVGDARYDGSFININFISATQFSYTDNNNAGLPGSAGGTINNPVDTGETALDVEWAHAIALGQISCLSN